ncbi:MAG TPA: hypothetical protein VGP22_09140, partial [Albitalea sp.]|nr:hypothetical protein [Albitalea sp.]
SVGWAVAHHSSVKSSPAPRKQRGFAIASAVFLVVVLALLGTMIVSLSVNQQVGSARDLAGTQAYYAAKAGIDWGVYRVLQGGTCAATSTSGLGGSATGFSVQLACTAFPVATDEAGVNVTVYQITATASRGTVGSLDHVERQLQAVVSTP